MRDSWRAQPGRIAVIDDNKFLRTFLRDAISEEGHEVQAFENAESFLAAPDLERFELVVTDLVMDGMGGLALIEQLSASHPGIEFIVVTMRDDADTAVRAMRAGAFDYLTKPVDPEVLRLAVAQALETRRVLVQNKRLQRNLELALAGQRVLACDIPERIAAETLTALLKHLDMSAGVVSVGDSALCVRNLEAVTAETLLAQAREVATIPVVADGGAISSALGPAVVVAAGEGDERLAVYVAHQRGGAEPDEEELADASFLIQHAHHALSNVRRYARARDEATRDALTGLHNARYFEEALQYALASGEFNGTAISVLFIDIDRFKEVNDNHGHLLGSALLNEMARVLERCVRDADVVARFGGDEFVVLLDQSDAEGALAVAERIRRQVEQRRFLVREGKSLRLTVCVGASSFPEHATDARALCDLADAAMYEGKADGRNLVRLAKRPERVDD